MMKMKKMGRAMHEHSLDMEQTETVILVPFIRSGDSPLFISGSLK